MRAHHRLRRAERIAKFWDIMGFVGCLLLSAVCFGLLAGMLLVFNHLGKIA